MDSYRAKKRLGQNFLISEKIIGRIIELINPTQGQTIVEVGSGLGALTKPLASSGAQIWAVEFDRDIIKRLEDALIDFKNVTILNRDFLAFHPEDYDLESFFLTGNLPYNITSPVLDWCVLYQKRIAGAIFMVQKEMAERITGKPGSRDWSPISIFTQLHFEAIHCFDVPPAAFSPQPEVTSSVIRLTPRKPIPLADPDLFEQVVRTSFTQRRKLLINNLVPELVATPQEMRDLLKALDLSEMARAEEISIPQFIRLAERIAQLNPNSQGK